MTSVIVRPEGDVVVTDEATTSVVVQGGTTEHVLVLDAGVASVVHSSDFVLVDPPGSPASVASSGNDVVVVAIGPSGSRGLTGPQGNQGISGAPGSPGIDGTPGGSYVFIQDVSSSVWDITHNLGFTPNVMIVDSLGEVGYGDTQVVSPNRIILTFTAQFSGFAYLS